jgi:uncharacterized protein YjbJ (UPF0337 family)
MNKSSTASTASASHDAWNDLKGKIKEKWDKFSDDEIDTLKDDLSTAVTLLQKVYGYAKEQAQEEYEEFKKSLRKVVKQVKNNKVFGPLFVVSVVSLLISASLIKSMWTDHTYDIR